MKKFKQLATMMIVVAASANLDAHSSDMQAAIPFDFFWGKVLLPAGDYIVHTQGTLVIVRKLDGKPANAYVRTVDNSGGLPHRPAGLSFRRYGNTYFLAVVWADEAGVGRMVPQTAQEAHVQRRTGTAVEATIMATRK